MTQTPAPDPNAAAYPDFETGKGEKPIAYVLIGLPGSGKSTWAKNHPKKLPIASTDSVIEAYAKKKNISYEEAFKARYKKAVDEMKKTIDNHTKKPKDFIWDQVNMTRDERMKIHNKLDATHRVVYVCFRVPLTECLRRHEEREREAGHIVDAQRIKDIASFARFPKPGDEPFYKLISLQHPDWTKVP